jgi:thiol-disulfide isomerase/thioredoxin
VRTTNWSLLAMATLIGCADPALEQRVAELEKKVTELDAKGPASAANPVSRAKPEQDPAAKAKEQAAMVLLQAANDAFESAQTEVARAKLEELAKDYAGTRAAARGERMKRELDIFGKAAPELVVDKWYTPQKGSFTEGKATVVVFFEAWCPHCKEEMPNLVSTGSKYKDKGLRVVGLTRVTKSATDEMVQQFIDTYDVNFPVGKDPGALASAFGVAGVPAAAVIKDGKVVWRGHPGRLSGPMLEKFLSS